MNEWMNEWTELKDKHFDPLGKFCGDSGALC